MAKSEPKMCACRRARGTHQSGNQWICPLCWAVEQRNQAARIKYAQRHARRGVHRVMDEFKIHCAI